MAGETSRCRDGKRHVLGKGFGSVLMCRVRSLCLSVVCELRRRLSVAMPKSPITCKPGRAAGRLIPFLVLLLFSPGAVTSLNICDYNDIVADVRAQLPTGMAVGGGGGGGPGGGGGGGGRGGRGRKLAQMSARGDAIGGE